MVDLNLEFLNNIQIRINILMNSGIIRFSYINDKRGRRYDEKVLTVMLENDSTRTARG